MAKVSIPVASTANEFDGLSDSQHRGAIAPNVLLADTTRWLSPARLAIGLTKAGCHVSAVCPTVGHPLRKTTAIRRIFSYSGFHPIDSLTSAIEAAQPQIVIPCDDRAVQHLHELF